MLVAIGLVRDFLVDLEVAVGSLGASGLLGVVGAQVFHGVLVDALEDVHEGSLLAFFLFAVEQFAAIYTAVDDFLGAAVVVGAGLLFQVGEGNELLAVFLDFVKDVEAVIDHLAAEVGKERKLGIGGGRHGVVAEECVVECIVEVRGLVVERAVIRVPLVAQLGGGLADGAEGVHLFNLSEVDIEKDIGYVSAAGFSDQVHEGLFDVTGHFFEFEVQDIGHGFSLVLLSPHGEGEFFAGTWCLSA